MGSLSLRQFPRKLVRVLGSIQSILRLQRIRRGRDTEDKVEVSSPRAQNAENLRKIMTYQALHSWLHIKDSPIAGQGIFAREEIPAGMVLGMSHLIVDEVIYRTPLGGFINHSEEPNCVKWNEDDKYFVKTLRAIHAGEELTLKYTFYTV